MTDEIPDEIMKEARKACEGFFPDPATRATAEQCVARAILAAEARATERERERCVMEVAAIAERHHEASKNLYAENNKDAARMASYTARNILDVATAIRKGDAP